MIGGRASVDPVHILDSSAGSSSTRIGGASKEEEEEEELVDVSTPTSSRSTTPAPNLSRPPTPAPAVSYPPAPAVSHITTPAPSVSQSVEAPASSVCCSRSPSPVEGESAPKKKRKGVTKLQKAEKASADLLKEVLEAQERLGEGGKN